MILLSGNKTWIRPLPWHA